MIIQTKKDKQQFLLQSNTDIFQIIILLGGQVHTQQLIRWLADGKTKSGKVSSFIKACKDAGLFKTDEFYSNDILTVTFPVYCYFGMLQMRYKKSVHKIKTGSLILEKYLKDGYAQMEPSALLRRMMQTTARYGVPDALLEYNLLDGLIKGLPEEFNILLLKNERDLMQKINRHEPHKDGFYLNLFQLRCRNIFVSCITKSFNSITINMDYFDVYKKEAKDTAKILIDAQVALQSIFSNSANSDYDITCVIDIHSHNEPNYKQLDKIFEYLKKDSLYIFNPDKVYQDFHFHHYRTKKALFSGVDRVA